MAKAACRLARRWTGRQLADRGTALNDHTARRLELDCLGSLPLGRRSTALTARPSAQSSTASSSPLGLVLESYGSLPLGRLLYRHSSALAACHSVTRVTTSKACHWLSA